jgi:hypothetical protein
MRESSSITSSLAPLSALSNSLKVQIDKLTSTAECLALLNDWYVNRQRKARAWSVFNTLYQGHDEPLSGFFARFEDCLAYINVDDDFQIQHLLSRVTTRYSYFLNHGTKYTLRSLMRRLSVADSN